MDIQSIVAIVTPFRANGRIDIQKLQELVCWHVEEGTDGIICSGTTGEAPTLSETDRNTVLEACLDAAKRRLPIFAGVGTSDTKQTIRFTEKAQKLGADGCLVVTPYYNKPSQRGCFLHFQAVSRVGLPMIIYNNPGRAVVQLQPETIAEIAALPHVIALKESTNDPQFLAKIKAITPCPILAGEDAITLEMIEQGAIGAVSVIGNLIPRIWREMIQAATKGDIRSAKATVSRYACLMKVMNEETNPVGVKAALSILGKCPMHLRLPLVEPTTLFYDRLTYALREAHLG